VQVVRSGGDPVAGHSKALALLTEAKQRLIHGWLARHCELERRRQELAFQTLAGAMFEVADWVRTASRERSSPMRTVSSTPSGGCAPH